MLIPVAEHDVAQELGSRLCEHFAFAADHAPGFRHRSVIQFRKFAADRGDAFFKLLKNLAPAGWLRKPRKLWSRCWIRLHEADDATGHKGQMIGQLPGRHGLFVWLPS